MSFPEILWRIRQTLRARSDYYTKARSDVPAHAGALLAELPLPDEPVEIGYFNQKEVWDYSALPWQGSVNQTSLAERYWTTIDYRNTETVGNAKVTWELNRHQFICKWIINGYDNETVISAFQLLVTQWIKLNRYSLGINWTSSLELALRLISWESAVRSIDRSVLDPRVVELLHASTREHVRHIVRYPSLFSSANNHRIGELTGILAAAAMFADDQQLVRAAKTAWKELLVEARLQVTSDGVCREQAIFYHIYTLLYLKRTVAYARELMLTVPPWLAERLGRMQAYLDATTDFYGQWFEVGDRDDGDLRALLPWPPLSDGADTCQERKLSRPAAAGFHPYPEGGYGIWKSADVHLLFRAGEFGYPAIAAHAHCDQLSILLKVGDIDVLTDSGTYCYHEEDRWRRYFKGSGAHNTVEVDGLDQAQYGGPFLWLTSPAAQLDYLDDTAAKAKLTVNYPNGSVCHERSLTFSPDGAEVLTVTDNLFCADDKRSHEYELVWNLGPCYNVAESNFSASENEYQLTITPKEQSMASTSFQVAISVSCPGSLALICGDEQQPAGFISHSFGEKEPITQIRISGSGIRWKAISRFRRIGTI